jgi:hypothetical protein
MGAGTYDSDRTKLVHGHAYAVLGLYKVYSNGRSYKLVKCYNPHGVENKY